MDRTLSERFWEKVDKRGEDECWEWQGAKFIVTHPYGQIWVNKKIELAHRISWCLHHGFIPKELRVLHHCDNPPCVNPQHLFLGTQSDNLIDAAKKGRLRTSPRLGENHHDSKLTDNEVLEMRSSYKEKREPYKIIAKRHNVHPTTVGRIIRNERWQHLLEEV